MVSYARQPSNQTRQALDRAVRDLAAGRPSWRSLDTKHRFELLRSLRHKVGEQGPGIATELAAAQGIDPTGLWGSEPWGIVFGMAQSVRALEWVMDRLARGEEPIPPGLVHRRSDGRVVVNAFPVRPDEKVLYMGTSAQVWMPPGVTPEQVRADAAAAYRGAGFPDPGVALLLAAGNVASLTLTDLLHLLFTDGCVVAVSMNPVLAYLRPSFEALFADFVAAGWVRFVDEGPEAGGYLATHPGIERVHMTGSAATYDAIMWGHDGHQEARKRAGTALLDKPFTAELGGVAPTVVVPGDWSDADVRRQAARLAYAKLFNAGHVCCSPQILVLPDDWPTSDALLDQIRAFMRTATPRVPYYPGTVEKVTRLTRGRASCEALLDPGHRLLVTGLDPDADDPLFTHEVFADVLGVVRLPSPSTDTYVADATTFCNQRLAGTLAADLVIDENTHKHHRDAVDRAVTDLRYGTIGINEWAVWSVNLGYTTWGAYPGHTPQDIGSGTGTVINAFMLHNPEKTVLRSRFHPLTPALMSITNKTAATTVRRTADYLTSDDPRHIPGMMLSAVRG